MNNHFLKKSKSWQFVWFFIKIAFRLFYKKIIIEGENNIPKNTSIIFAPNHQNALMDPLAILYASKAQVVFLSRADIFTNKSISKFLSFLKIIPIFRIKDGKENLQKNDTTFDLSIKILKNKQCICIFPEATHNNKRQLLTHKKAIPKLAFQAEERNKFNLNINIIPIGIYYSDYYKLGSILHIKIGESICVKEFEKQYYENPQIAINLLKEKLFLNSQKLVVDIQNNEYYQSYITIIEMLSSEIKDIKEKLIAEKKYSINLDYLFNNDNSTFLDIINKIKKREKILKKYRIRENERISNISSKKHLLLNYILAMALFPCFLIGVILNIIPYFLLKLILSHTEDKQLYSTIKLVFGIVLFPFYIFILLGIISKYISYFYNSLLNSNRKINFSKKHNEEYNKILNIEEKITKILKTNFKE